MYHRWDTDPCREAAYSGHLHILKWARERGCPWTDIGVLIDAAHEGQLEVKRIYSQIHIQVQIQTQTHKHKHTNTNTQMQYANAACVFVSVMCTVFASTLIELRVQRIEHTNTQPKNTHSHTRTLASRLLLGS